MTPSLVAGACAGTAGLLVFLVIHHFWIQPIWYIAPIGLVVAAVGGLAVGWSYQEIRHALPPPPWTFLALSAIILLILAPAILLAQRRPPLIDPETISILPGGGRRAAIHFVGELVVTAVLMGGVIGWLLGRTPQAALATALAGLAYALGPGHNIPFLGNTPAVGKGLILLLAITLVSALVLVEASAWMLRR